MFKVYKPDESLNSDPEVVQDGGLIPIKHNGKYIFEVTHLKITDDICHRLQHVIDNVQVLRLNNLNLNIYFSHGLLEFNSNCIIEELDLCKSHLSVLPPSIGKLQHLRKLYLDYNELTTLPFSIYHCTRLNYLSLTFNKISFFPGVLLLMTSLKDVRRQSNPTDYSISQLASVRDLNYIRQVSVSDVCNEWSTNEVPSLKEIAIQKALSANITRPYWRDENLPYILIRQLDKALFCHRVCECCHCCVAEDSLNGIFIQWLHEEFLGLKMLPFQSFACTPACAVALINDLIPRQQHIVQDANRCDQHLVKLNTSKPARSSSRASCHLQ